MTPRELAERADAFRWRHRESQRMLLSAALLIIAPWVKEPPSLASLMGEDESEVVDRLIGAEDLNAKVDAALAKQAARKQPP